MDSHDGVAESDRIVIGWTTLGGSLGGLYCIIVVVMGVVCPLSFFISNGTERNSYYLAVNVKQTLLATGARFVEDLLMENLPGVYYIDYIIAKRFMKKNGWEYLVKWQDWGLDSCTWEPGKNLPNALEIYHRCPGIAHEVLQDHTDRLFISFRRSLAKKHIHSFNLDFRLDVFRFTFKDDKSLLVYKEDFNSLPLPESWDSLIYNVHGDGRAVNFPIRVTPQLKWLKGNYIKTVSDGCEYEYMPTAKIPNQTLRIDFTTRRM